VSSNIIMRLLLRIILFSPEQLASRCKVRLLADVFLNDTRLSRRLTVGHMFKQISLTDSFEIYVERGGFLLRATFDIDVIFACFVGVFYLVKWSSGCFLHSYIIAIIQGYMPHHHIS
jgi:hypothetical protein